MDVRRGVSPGFFGKMPSRGDFVTRRLPASFVGPWDSWLQRALAASQASLGSAWLDVYLTSPMWRFALAPGLCGEEAYVGVVVPSVDRVGRYFPLAAVLPCGGERSPLDLAVELDDWYGETENLLLATLADTPLSLEAFDERLSRLVVALASTPPRPAPSWRLGDGALPLRWHCPVAAACRLRDAAVPLLSGALEGHGDGYGVWWTQGSERVEPCVVVASELPEAEAFVAMLDGRWSERGWSSRAAVPEAPRDVSARARVCRSAAVSHPGKVRSINEDSFASSDDARIWIVADGLGGHQAGEAASRMVASVVDQIGPAAALGGRVERLELALRIVNGCLRVVAETSAEITLAGSTVAALMIEGTASACVWAGDSRVYRLRDGALQQLSRDHSDLEGGARDRAITRAVGGTDDLELEIEQADVRDGDRYLLCTDGLHGEVSARDIAAALALPDPTEACRQLQQAVLKGEARDNLTAVVVHVLAAPSSAEEAGR